MLGCFHFRVYYYAAVHVMTAINLYDWTCSGEVSSNHGQVSLSTIYLHTLRNGSMRKKLTFSEVNLELLPGITSKELSFIFHHLHWANLFVGASDPWFVWAAIGTT